MKNKFLKGIGIGFGVGLAIFLSNVYRENKEKEELKRERDTFGTGQ